MHIHLHDVVPWENMGANSSKCSLTQNINISDTNTAIPLKDRYVTANKKIAIDKITWIYYTVYM